MNNYCSRAASAGPGMVACLVGPGPEEDILLLDFDFLMSSFGEGLFALCTKRCLTQQRDGLKVERRTALSQRGYESGGDMCSAQTQRDITKTWRDRMRRIGRLQQPIAEISHLVGT